MSTFIQQSWKAVATALAAGAAAYPGNQNIGISIAVGLAAGALVWYVPNKPAA